MAKNKLTSSEAPVLQALAKAVHRLANEEENSEYRRLTRTVARKMDEAAKKALASEPAPKC